MIIKTEIDEFLKLATQYPVLDVRSPGEYAHAHLPGALNMPLFTDEERKVVGTAYKQQSRETAIKIGLDYFGVKMRKMVEEAEAIIQKNKPKRQQQSAADNCILVHCWRGGMRSAGVAWLLDLYGFKVYTLKGGYKAFRQWSLRQFAAPCTINVLGGYTGSGKTMVLHQLAKQKQKTIDLEGLANHKGSAFGGLGKTEMPSQEMFENRLALAIHACNSKENMLDAIWVEDESRRIGNINIPDAFWSKMRNSPVYFLDIPSEARLDYIVQDYGKFKKEDLIATIMRISKRLGGLATKQAINYLLEDNHKECFRILLAYYDKYYLKGLHDRERLSELLINVPSPTVEPVANANELLKH
jgi:tRNA 2-selenouridine synthase